MYVHNLWLIDSIKARFGWQQKKVHNFSDSFTVLQYDVQQAWKNTLNDVSFFKKKICLVSLFWCRLFGHWLQRISLLLCGGGTCPPVVLFAPDQPYCVNLALQPHKLLPVCRCLLHGVSCLNISYPGFLVKAGLFRGSGKGFVVLPPLQSTEVVVVPSSATSCSMMPSCIAKLAVCWHGLA